MPSGPAFLAGPKATRSVRKSPTRLGPGFRGRELCVVVWSRPVVDRGDSEPHDWSGYVFARVRRAFCNHATDPKAAKRVEVGDGNLEGPASQHADFIGSKRVTTLPS